MMRPSKFLCKRFGFSQEMLFSYASTCPRRYKKYKIPKRNGKFRKIAQPAKNLKVMQRVLLSELFQDKMPIHDCAKAYRANMSILDNATPHLKNKYLLKMDFKNFFPSIKAPDFAQYLAKNNILSDEQLSEFTLVTNIFFMWEDGELVLSIGAPSSPLISNAIMYDFDETLFQALKELDVSYTRYSDDLTFSTNKKDVLFKVPSLVEDILDKQNFPKIEINDSKTVFSSKKHNRHVTGVTISNDGEASLGRSRKREIQSRVYMLSKQKISKKEIAKLRGYVSFANVVEPTFFEKLKVKYPEQMKLLFRND